MSPYPTAILLVVALLMLSSCATTPASSVPVYEGVDRVTVVKPEHIVGDWNLMVLNPREGQHNGHTRVSYTAEGRFTATLPGDADTSSPLSDITLYLQGDWIAADGQLITRNVQVSSDSQEEIAMMLTTLMNEKSEELASVANVYEQSANHLVLVSDDGIATRYERQ